MMTLAQDMGMEKLKIECEDHVISTMKGELRQSVDYKQTHSRICI